MVEGLAGALDVAVLVLEIAKKNVQDFDPEVASVQHGCELRQKYVATTENIGGVKGFFHHVQESVVLHES